MIPLFRNIVYQTVKRRHEKSGKQVRPFTDEEIKQAVVYLYHVLKDVLLISMGVVAAGFGLKGFLLPNSFIDGGVTGVSLLLNIMTEMPLGLLLIIINLPFIMLGYFQINRAFAMRSIAAICGLAACVLILDYPVVTSDKLLVSVFGGFFLGAGIGLAVRGGAVIDGTELLAIYLSRRLFLSVGDIIWVINIFIFSVAAYFLSVETALYSILIYLAAAKTADFIIEGIEEYTGITIISIRPEAIRVMITEKLGRGVTMYQGKGGYGRPGQDLAAVTTIYTVVTRLEVSRLLTEIDAIDEKAFIVMNSIRDTRGGMIKKRTIKDH